MWAFTQVIKGKQPRCYVDLLAGPGRCHLDDDPSYHFEGSPMIAAATEPAFDRMLFLEADPACARALRARLSARGLPPESVIETDCNRDDAIERARRALAGTLGLVFADTLGLSTIQHETLRKLTRHRRFDLIYTFHVSDVTRNVGATLHTPSEAARFAASLGSDWQTAWQAYRHAHPARTDAAAIEDFFRQQLLGLGFPYVEPLRSVMKNRKGAPLYRLWLASHYEGAPALWKGISDIAPSGQRSLL
jgi:three-Cys-motif partner protein